VAATLHIADGLGELGADEQLVIYRIVQEALNNITRHAGARQVRVELSCRGVRPILRVIDDGRGFPEDERGLGDGLGITGMRERARLAGGRLNISSVAGHGTVVELAL
jgi:two-component system sensor histidine kinase UhpB